MTTAGQISRATLLKTVIFRFGAGLLSLCILLFVPAGTLGYWQAWVWLGILVIPLLVLMVYMFRTNPALLERRLRLREPEPEQSLIIKLSYIPVCLLFPLAGLDHRFGWSHVPLGAVLAGDLVVIAGFCLFMLVLRANSYASRVVEIEKEQRVVRTGPYSLVRHPMYLAVLLIYFATPLALGSYWVYLPVLFIAPVLVARISNEERVLLSRLAGYTDYVASVRYRLIPGVW